MAAGDELVFAPLGGVGEIGMNLSIYGFGPERRRTWLAVDLGVAFGSEELLPGVDLIMPDVRFLAEERHNLVGIVLTHAHEDHFGALIDLWPRLRVPVYATPFTAALFEAKRLGEPGAPKIPIEVVPLGARFTLGPFDIELVSVAHSIPESNALIIRTPLGTVLHTGDWKLDPTPVIGAPTDEAKLRALGAEGVLALIGDSTNAVREGRSPSEADVGRSLAELIRSAKGRVAVTTLVRLALGHSIHRGGGPRCPHPSTLQTGLSTRQQPPSFRLCGRLQPRRGHLRIQHSARAADRFARQRSKKLPDPVCRGRRLLLTRWKRKSLLGPAPANSLRYSGDASMSQ